MPIQNPNEAYREYTAPLGEGETFSQHHIKVREQDLSRYCLIPGSHLRGRRIAERLEGARVIGATRGYWLYAGEHQGVRVTVCSTGMGGPVVAMAMEELGRMGVDTFIRVGSAGALQDFLGVGDIVVATAAVRDGGTANHYLPAGFPAAAHFGLTRELVESAARLGQDVYTGLCQSSDAFYAPEQPQRTALLKRAGLLAIEMECDTQFIVGQYHGWRCAAAFVLDGGPARAIREQSGSSLPIASHAHDPAFLQGEERLIQICLDAMAATARKDGKSG